ISAPLQYGTAHVQHESWRRSFATSDGTTRSTVINRCEGETRLQGVRSKTLLLCLELAHGNRGEISTLRLGRGSEPCHQLLDPRAQAGDTSRERLRSCWILLARSLDEHPSAARLTISDLEIA